MATTSTFLKALESATQADLDQLNAEIVDLEKQLAKRHSQRKMVEILLGVAPVKNKGGRKKAAPAAAKPDDDEGDDDEPATPSAAPLAPDARRLAIAKMLLNGSKRVADIAAEVGASLGTTYTSVAHAWFGKNGDGTIHLTSAGRAAATGKPQSA